MPFTLRGTATTRTAAQVSTSILSSGPPRAVPRRRPGIVHVRGRWCGRRLRSVGLPAIAHAIDHRIVVVQVGNRVAGLLVDSAREVLNIDEAAFEKPPDVIEAQSSGFVTAIATVAKRLFLLVDVPRVIGEELPHG